MEKRGKLEKDAQIMIKMLPQQVEFEKKMQKSQQKAVDERSQSATTLHKAVSFDHSELEGRFGRTTGYVKVGEEILMERAICTALNEKFAKSHCQHCFTRYSNSWGIFKDYYYSSM